ncbi:MAG: hypothetical protein CL843_19005 [Crocinitomicaceae bacterium]|nr:hypothetical protein [Crocinitomicaceae bacterium]
MRKKYVLKRQHGGRGMYAGVELEIIPIKGSVSKVANQCRWSWEGAGTTDGKGWKAWEEVALKTVQYVIDTYQIQRACIVTLRDLTILPVDTTPSHVAIATIACLFELLNDPLNEEDMEHLLDNTVGQNNTVEMPDLTCVKLSKALKN